MAMGCWGQKGDFLLAALQEHPFPREERPMAFHARDGWYFERVDDVRPGLVAITHPGGEISFDADTWASIVASVSAVGENAESFKAAETLHAGLAF